MEKPQRQERESWKEGVKQADNIRTMKDRKTEKKERKTERYVLQIEIK